MNRNLKSDWEFAWSKGVWVQILSLPPCETLTLGFLLHGRVKTSHFRLVEFTTMEGKGTGSGPPG